VIEATASRADWPEASQASIRHQDVVVRRRPPIAIEMDLRFEDRQRRRIGRVDPWPAGRAAKRLGSDDWRCGDAPPTKPTAPLWKPQLVVAPEKYGVRRDAGARPRRFAAAIPPLRVD
jgi:hypothetical protein